MLSSNSTVAKDMKGNPNASEFKVSGNSAILKIIIVTAILRDGFDIVKD